MPYTSMKCIARMKLITLFYRASMLLYVDGWPATPYYMSRTADKALHRLATHLSPNNTASQE
jgi:hypothetical protein